MDQVNGPPALYCDPSGELCLWVWIEPDDVGDEPCRKRIPVDFLCLCNLAEAASREIAKQTRKRDARPAG